MTKPIHFEQSISELEAIVAQLEQGELSLEDSLKQFEKGITAVRHCQTLLKKAEKKIELLSVTSVDMDTQSDD